MDWAPALRDVLGSEGTAEPSKITFPTWMELDTSFWETTEKRNQTPWDHWMPADPNHSGWNKITLYRKRAANGRYNFQLIRGWVKFYEGGDDSPARQAQMLVEMSQSTIGAIGSNPYLDSA